MKELLNQEAPLVTHKPPDEDLAIVGYAWWWFTCEFPRLERIHGNDIRGFSLTCHVAGWLLVVREVRDGIPQVVYTRKTDPTGSVETFMRKWLEGTLTYFPDRYA